MSDMDFKGALGDPPQFSDEEIESAISSSIAKGKKEKSIRRVGSVLAIVAVVGALSAGLYLRPNKDNVANAPKATGYLVVRGQDLVQTDFSGGSEKKLMTVTGKERIVRAVQSPSGRTFVEINPLGPNGMGGSPLSSTDGTMPSTDLQEVVQFQGVEPVAEYVAEIIDGKPVKLIDSHSLVNISPDGSKLLLRQHVDPESYAVWDVAAKKNQTVFDLFETIKKDGSKLDVEQAQELSEEERNAQAMSMNYVGTVPKWADDEHLVAVVLTTPSTSANDNEYLTKNVVAEVRQYSLKKYQSLSEGKLVKKLDSGFSTLEGRDETVGTWDKDRFKNGLVKSKFNRLTSDWEKGEEVAVPENLKFDLDTLMTGMPFYPLKNMNGEAGSFFELADGEFRQVPVRGMPVGYAAS